MKKIILLLTVTAVIVITGCKKKEETEPTVTAVTKGCMDPKSTNYNPNATEDDGSCAYLASSTGSNKKALLEDFTGVKCTYCPTGHRNTEDYVNANPGKLIVIATQSSSSYGVPYSGQPDLRTSFASALEVNSGLTGYPAGTISRTVFTNSSYGVQASGKMAMYLTATGWFGAANEITSQIAPVNIGIKASYDANTRILTAEVETYYTSEITQVLYMNVAITEDNLVVKQIDLGVVKPNYIHKDVLRTYVTGQWGEKITTATTLSTRTKNTYTYTLPSEWNASNCKVVAFVSEYKKNILNVEEVKVIQ